MKKYIIIISIIVIMVSTCFYVNYQQKQKIDNFNLSNDPLNLFGNSNNELEGCLNQVNSSDPLGLNNETENQKIQRESCIKRYKK